METILFAGIEGQVLQSSQHGSFLVVKLSNQITICGAVNNIWDWNEAPDRDSGFESFITYVGVSSIAEATEIKTILKKAGGYFQGNEEEPRKSKRVVGSPMELKVRGLNADFVSYMAILLK
ncbi:MAG: hypothetical protein EAZ73_09135 [Oscillatoriales cyanobacterium]|uniref:hypothetical protein n=1 Tax=unclassified Microcoleus TaxID=2642155 RepID=UPI001D638251|nr:MULTISPECIES: hypothetical protein [unclassified Microcoleus]TAF00862.1 MAG: hypothetical protein EAZ79_01460 [Oscillatoriales cyanobacterium]MCC3459800.1 hypothetical protein [Microcoleus sp. PH2017_11_PCY_U_A]MCC3478234.1 hypothetical protein [Microcoleus sp. PH2017_12_PCY_D_A]TAF21379.1 MAG: hypothetical protein EAZ73_09135 [Oscillatoriales cyanobacterium]TAF39694.1 MAG: hypothetical protein EAZ69_00210 [Oscillatoriales cyanobacterium]